MIIVSTETLPRHRMAALHRCSPVGRRVRLAIQRSCVYVMLCMWASTLLACERPSPTPRTVTPTQEEESEQGEGRLITTPSPETPEGVIQSVLRASLTADEEMGWDMLLSVLHSGNKTAKALRDWRGMKFPASRRKAHLFVSDEALVHFRIMRIDTPQEDAIRLFVFNAESLPTPCELRRDPEANNAWRVWVCSL